MTESSLYERLGGAFAIAAVIDHFSDAVVRNPIAGQTSENPQLREWSTDDLDRPAGTTNSAAATFGCASALSLETQSG